MALPNVVSPEEWTAARVKLLEMEKALDRQRDQVSAERRKLPMVKVEKAYAFAGPNGASTLRGLFGKHRQLIVYHFMFDPAWEAGCKSCSFLADSFDTSIVHLPARDTAFAAVSRAPLPKLEAFQKRMGWTFPWYSSSDSDFNFDYHVSFHAGGGEYNYKPSNWNHGGEAPGASVFYREGETVFHTYSTYARGLDQLINTYHWIDLTPLGRQEEGLPHGMSWVRLHDSYESAT